MVSRRGVIRAVTWMTVAAVVVLSLYIMLHGLGLSDKLDFGAGAYYYADIPGFEKLLRSDMFTTSIPYWVYVVLFLAWGWLMFRLWVRIEGRK